MLLRIRFLIALFSLFPLLSVAVETVSLPELAQLARSGAPQLALQRLDAQQPPDAVDPVTWMRYERERVYLLRVLGDLDAVIARLAALPQGLSADFRNWAHTEWAAALLEQQRPQEALAVTRNLLWTALDADPEARARWRRMVISGYLADGVLEDARSALVRYQQDFGDGSEEWKHLRDQVLLRTGRYDEMLAAVDGKQDAVTQVLATAARLRNSTLSAQQAYDAAIHIANGDKTPDVTRALAWQLAVEAAQPLTVPVYIDTLEHALAFAGQAEPGWELFPVQADMLWDAWIAHGQALGNQEQRLLGSDDDWYFPATEAIEKNPARARVLFAILSVYGSSQQRRELAHEYLVSLLANLPQGERLIRNLYLQSRRFSAQESLPGVIRYRLIDEALESGDLNLASQLMQGMEAPPPGTDALEWGLRRARVAIHTARPEEGARVLATLLNDETPLQEVQLDRWIQVVFDLQTVHAHAQALPLFESLMRHDLDPQRRRELLFWQADSWQALGNPAQAAYLYLQSATLLDPSAMDPWAQTARYHAAQSLTEARLLQDARRIYTTLLNSTREPGRRAVLRNEIQRLQLRSVTQEVMP